LSIGDSLLFYFEKPRGFWRAPQIARELPTAMTLIEWRIYRQVFRSPFYRLRAKVGNIEAIDFYPFVVAVSLSNGRTT
jgi:hypothetical protein